MKNYYYIEQAYVHTILFNFHVVSKECKNY
jgi:hypothetical protein